MNREHNDINDDEIRIIAPDDSRRPRGRRRRPLLLIPAALLLLLLIPLLVAKLSRPAADEATEPVQLPTPPAEDRTEARAEAFATLTDTVVNGIGLSILTPFNTLPKLEIGNGVLADSTAVLTVQAADVRGDNGDIVGSFVVGGELISKGEAKAGFCSIIDGKMTIGVADATPAFEQALVAGGDFFRQYPLVVGGQVVENKPKGKSIRKALAEIDGRARVVVSRGRVSFGEFSQALVDAGARNAIYLVGGSSYGSFRGSDGSLTVFGPAWPDEVEKVNYLVWR